MTAFLDMTGQRFGSVTALRVSERPVRVEIPPGVAHGWISLGNEPLVVLNMPDLPYDGTDEYRTDPRGPVATGLPAVDFHEKCDG